MSRNFIRQENLDADSVVDEPKGKVRFLSVITGEGDPSEPPPVPEKAWVYFDVTDDEAAVPFVWDPDSETWIPGAAGAIGGGSQPLILDVPGDSDPVTVPGPDVSMDIILRLLPSTVGGENQKIIIPRPTGSGQRITGVVGVNMDDAQTDWYPGESVWYVAPVVEPATRASLDLAPLLGLTYPLAANVTVNVVFDSASGGAPTSVPVTLNDTYADATAVALDLIGQTTAAQAAHGFTFGPIPDTDSGIGFYSALPGAASVTLNSIVGGGALAAALAAAVATAGLDEVEGDTDTEYGILHLDPATLGSPLDGGTHTSLNDASPHQKGWTIIDVAPGVWSVEQWPFRARLMPMNWLEQFFGPLGKGEEQKTLEQLIYQLRAFVVPQRSQRTLVHETRNQVTSGLDKDRFLLFSTALAESNLTFWLAEADAPQPNSAEPGFDLGCRGYELEFWRSPDDSSEFSLTVDDDSGYAFSLAPGEYAKIRSQLVGYVDSGLPAGTAPGQLDDPVNQIFQWVRIDNEVGGGNWKEDVIRSNFGGVSIAAGSAAGTAPTVSIMPSSNDSAGAVAVTTDTDPASGVLATVTFENPFPGVAWPVLAPADPQAANAVGVYALPEGLPVTAFRILTTAPLSASTEYEWTYHVIGVPD